MQAKQTLKMTAAAFTLVLSVLPTAQAERPDHAGKGGSEHSGQRGGPDRESRNDRQRGMPDHEQRGDRQRGGLAREFQRDQERKPAYREPMQGRGQDSGRQATRTSGPATSITVGAYFGDDQRRMAHEYYSRPEYARSCPPGLAKKGNGCMPPGQARKWRKGYPLPRDVIYYEVPSSLIVQLGVPPAGYRYVRVATDILLIAVGTGMVIDAIDDLLR